MDNSKEETKFSDPKLQEYYDYFKDDLDAIEEELTKSKDYSKILDEQIDLLKQPQYSKAGGHLLVEQIQNAVQLQTQRQSLRRDRFNIKKTMMDYANKNNEKTGDEEKLLDVVRDLVKSQQKANAEKPQPVIEQDDDELDKIIDSQLEDTN